MNIINKTITWIKARRVSYVTRKILSRYGVGNKLTFCGMPKLIIHETAAVSIGSGFVCRSTPDYAVGNFCCSKIDIRANASLEIGDCVGISNGVIQCHYHVRIGNHVNIGDGTLIMDTDFHSLNWQERADRSIDTERKKCAAVIIGDYAFIGARSIIGKGVTIGERSIIAAGSVVVKDIPNDCIAGGNPCKVIRVLNENEGR